MLLSDYAKGVLTARVIRNVIDAARKLGKRVIVDPKSANFAIYRGATLLTPNRKEFAEATRSRADTEKSIADAAQDAMQLADCEAMLVTQSEHGMTLVPRKGEAIHVPAHPVKVRDVSGAGDTVAAVLAVTLAAGADWETALRMANAAAAVAVGKKGTAIVTPAELRRKILPHASLAAEEKIVAAGGDLDAHLADWRKQGLRIGFTNGCFDILHPGHVKVLTAARGACDRLIVGLNSDASVKRLKGEGRPVQDERARAEVLAALEAVDLVAHLRGGHADRPDHADQAERAGQGRRLHPRAGRRPRDRRSRWRRGAAGRYPARLQHDVAGRSRAGRQGVSAAARESRAARCRGRRWRDPAAWAKTVDIFAVLIAAFAAVVDVAGRDLRGRIAGLGGADARRQGFPAIAEAADLRRCRSRCSRWRGRNAVVGRAWGARLYAVGPAAKLLMLPVLFYHFERSARGMWVFVAFLVSCALLMVMSWIVAVRSRARRSSRDAECGVPVKNYIDQSQEFALCAVVLAYPVVTLLRRKRIWLAVLLIAVSPELRRQHGVRHRVADRAGHHADHAGGVRVAAPEMAKHRHDRLARRPCCGAMAWMASPQLRGRTETFSPGLPALQGTNVATSIGLRLEFWRKSLRFLCRGADHRPRHRIDARTVRAGRHRPGRRLRRGRSAIRITRP